MKSIWLTIIIVLGITFSTASAADPPVIKVGGGGAACQGFFVPFKASFEAEAGIKVDIAATSPAQGLIDLNKGTLDIATCAVPFTTIIKGAAEKGVTIDPQEFSITEVGTNHTLVFLHKSNKVVELSKKQLQEIFAGKVTNWAQMGGDDREIIVVWSKGTPGQNELFITQILDGGKVVNDAMEAADYTDIREKVARTPGAVGIDPQGYVSAITKNPKTPPITSPVIAITRINPPSKIEKLLAYIKSNSW